MIIPGVASIDTIIANHSLKPTEQAVAGSDRESRKHVEGTKGNEGQGVLTPAYNDMEEAAILAGLDVTVEIIFNQQGETVALYAGELRVAHEASVHDAKRHFLTPKAEEKDIVIANAFAKPGEAPLAIKTAVSVKKSGGDFVLIANAPDGSVVHYLSGFWGKTIGGRNKRLFPIPENIKRLIVYNEYPDIAGLQCYGDSPKVILMTKWEQVLRTLQEVHGDNADVALYPNADTLYFG